MSMSKTLVQAASRLARLQRKRTKMRAELKELDIEIRQQKKQLRALADETSDKMPPLPPIRPYGEV